LELSPDFLDYFQTLYPLLVYDKTLWCISAWNDNGIDKKIAREPSKKRKMRSYFNLFVFQALLHRTDFFPGLGWLLTKTIWNEIKANWPAGYEERFAAD
jgi:alpha-1,3-mannosyl-glycoprotein beta-1,2-N-acetylglucosaminyltransferase